MKIFYHLTTLVNVYLYKVMMRLEVFTSVKYYTIFNGLCNYIVNVLSKVHNMFKIYDLCPLKSQKSSVKRVLYLLVVYRAIFETFIKLPIKNFLIKLNAPTLIIFRREN